MTFVAIIAAFAVLGFGLFVVGLLLVTAIRNKKEWAGASLVLTDEQKAELQDPASLGVQPPSADGVGAETQAVAGAEFRNKTYNAGGFPF